MAGAPRFSGAVFVAPGFRAALALLLAAVAPAFAQLAPRAAEPPRAPAEKRYLPASINEPLMSMRIRVVQETAGACLYRSGHFEFKTPVKLGTAAMTEVCRAFESTHELVSKLPWGITPRPRDGAFFKAELFRTREDYLAGGAPPWSAAYYSLEDGIFRIPFEEVGLASRGDTYYLSGSINNDTITHEVTHQMMHDYLRFMPIWMAEGTAEYTSHLPYNSGRYSVTNALEGFKIMRRRMGKEKRRGNFIMQPGPAPRWMGAGSLWAFTTSITQPRPIANLTFEPARPSPPAPDAEAPMPGSKIMTRPPAERVSLPDVYFSAHVLIFHFMHFDGDGKATRLKKFFDAIHEERKQWGAFDASLESYKTAIARYQAEWEEFKKKPGVQDLGGGQIRYPSSLTPPTAPPLPATPGNVDPSKVCAKHLGLLLDGRTLEQLDREVRAAFAKAEVAL